MGGRIGKVRMKETGFEFRVINGPPEPESDFGARLLSAARDIAADDGLAGYVVIGLTEDGGYRCGFRWDDARSPIPRTLMPAYMAELVRREMITDVEAERVSQENFEWVE